MRALRPVAVIALLSAAFVLAAARRRRAALAPRVRSGDRELARRPVRRPGLRARRFPWSARAACSGSATPLRLRRRSRVSRPSSAAGSGYDNGLSESRTRGELEASARRARHSPAPRRSRPTAANLLGILAFADASRARPGRSGAGRPGVADFQAAVRLDPDEHRREVQPRAAAPQAAREGRAAGPEQQRRRAPARAGGAASGGIPGRGY